MSDNSRRWIARFLTSSLPAFERQQHRAARSKEAIKYHIPDIPRTVPQNRQPYDARRRYPMLLNSPRRRDTIFARETRSNPPGANDMRSAPTPTRRQFAWLIAISLLSFASARAVTALVQDGQECMSCYGVFGLQAMEMLQCDSSLCTGECVSNFSNGAHHCSCTNSGERACELHVSVTLLSSNPPIYEIHVICSPACSSACSGTTCRMVGSMATAHCSCLE